MLLGNFNKKIKEVYQMNVFVMTDLEGICGIYSPDQVMADRHRFNEGRRYMTDDVNVCVSALKEAGVDKIYVCDCHSASHTLEWDRLSSDADGYICGNTGGRRFPCIEEFDAVILLGYHAMAGSSAAVLEHTWSSKLIQNVYINDTKVGEIAIDASILGEQGKKVIMVSGDDKACAEARDVIPNVVTAEVKKSLSSFGSILTPPETARKILREKTIEAVKNAANVNPVRVCSPVSVRVELTERKLTPSTTAHPYVKTHDGRTFSTSADTVEEAFMRAASLL